MSSSITEQLDPSAVAGAAAPAIRIEGVHKRFGDVDAVRGVDLDIHDGEFFSMLGPSGSGKTTVLRMIAGFEAPTVGRIHLAGRDVTRVPPFDRDVNTVFQDYALFPHMSVVDNVAYGLRVKGVRKAERRRRAEEALERVRLGGFGARRPAQLSGGQRQRVALARALVNQPRVLLLDEPLGALDLKLRQQMQIELKALQRDVGITFVFVTHDQEEALTMSDRIAVFNAGRIEQVGSATELYEQPTTPFVAGFVGSTNLLSGADAARLFGDSGTWALRPERIRVAGRDEVRSADEAAADGTVLDAVYLGSSVRLQIALDGGGQLTVSRPNTDGSAFAATPPGTAVRVLWHRDHARKVDEPAGGSTAAPDQKEER